MFPSRSLQGRPGDQRHGLQRHWLWWSVFCTVLQWPAGETAAEMFSHLFSVSTFLLFLPFSNCCVSFFSLCSRLRPAFVSPRPPCCFLFNPHSVVNKHADRFVCPVFPLTCFPYVSVLIWRHRSTILKPALRSWASNPQAPNATWSVPYWSPSPSGELLNSFNYFQWIFN